MRVPKVVRASPSFYGRRRMDFVSHSRPQRNARCYSQLRLLFKASSRAGPHGEELHVPLQQEFAFLRCFEAVGSDVGDKLATAGCTRIKPDTLRNRPWYEVVPFADLLSREFVTPKCNEPGIHHVSCFVSNWNFACTLWQLIDQSHDAHQMCNASHCSRRTVKSVQYMYVCMSALEKHAGILCPEEQPFFRIGKHWIQAEISCWFPPVISRKHALRFLDFEGMVPRFLEIQWPFPVDFQKCIEAWLLKYFSRLHAASHDF